MPWPSHGRSCGIFEQGSLLPGLTSTQLHALAESSFTRYFEHAAQLLQQLRVQPRALLNCSHAIAEFELHQVAETICKVVLVVFTAYLPKTHDLDELGRRCIRACPSLGPLVPQHAPGCKRLTGLLRDAYVDARYSFRFQISRQDLEALARYLCAFRARAEGACQERVAALAMAARMVAGGDA